MGKISKGERPFINGEIGTRTPTIFLVYNGEIIDIEEGMIPVLNTVFLVEQHMARHQDFDPEVFENFQELFGN